MSQSIERSGLLPHTHRTVTLLTRIARSGPATAGLPTRLVLSFMAGLLSLIVLAGLPAEAAAAGGACRETAFEQRPTSEPAPVLSVERIAVDLEESETQWRLGPAVSAPMPEAVGACRSASDDAPGGTGHWLPERPPRA